MSVKKFKKYLYKLLSFLTFGKLKEFFENKFAKYGNCNLSIDIKGVNNSFDIEVIKKLGINLSIYGDNNEISINKDAVVNNNVSIIIHGSNNKINIEQIIIGQQLRIIMGFPTCKTKNSSIIIKKKTRFVNTEIMLLEEESTLNIGEDCLFSENVLVHLSDTHSIFDLDGNLINYGGNVKIGNRVWVGRDVRILKKALISDDSVVGGSAIVTGKFLEPHCIIAGNPAKIVKRGVRWSCNPPQYSKNLINEK